MKLTNKDTITLRPQVSTGFSYGGEVRIEVWRGEEVAVTCAENLPTCDDPDAIRHDGVFIDDPALAARYVRAVRDLDRKASEALGSLRDLRKIGVCCPNAIRGMETVISPV